MKSGMLLQLPMYGAFADTPSGIVASSAFGLVAMVLLAGFRGAPDVALVRSEPRSRSCGSSALRPGSWFVGRPTAGGVHGPRDPALPR